MKSLYLFCSKILFTCLFGLIALTAKAQTTLVKGDLAFTGYIGNGGGNDEFSFVLLRAITANTVIKFTENGWTRTSATVGALRTGEGAFQYTSVALPAGAEIRIVCTATPTATYAGLGGSAGTVTILAAPEGNAGTLAFSVNGDQIIAYQGASTSPTLIAAIHMNSYNMGIPAEPITNTTDWDGAYNNSTASGLPGLTGSNFLTNGVDAIWIPANPAVEFDNARFNCTGPLTTVAQIRTALFNVANWTTTDNVAGFTLPTNCNYLGTFIPVQLISFQAQNNINDVTTKWQVTNEIDLSNYEVERSFDNKTFDRITTIAANNNSGGSISTYTYTDRESLNNNAPVIYYRLKMNDRDGKFYYSEIVSIRNKKGASFVIDNLVNPVKDRLSFTLTTKTAGIVNVQLTDANGKIVASKSMQVSAGSTTVNMPETAAMAKGIYFLKIITADGNTVTRLIK
jgi:Secretion system C-terminal sorting domain